MKKLFLFFIVLMFVSLNINAQNQQIIVGKNYVHPNEVTLVAAKSTSTTIRFDLNELNLTEIETNYGNAVIMSSAKAPLISEKGSPEMIYLPAAIIIPDMGSTELNITYGEYTEFENIEIAPSKGHLPRNIDPETIPYVKGEVYNQNAFYPGIPATLNEPFIIRDVRGQSIFAYPVQYNPMTKVLRVYSEITITVNNTPDAGINEFTNQKKHKTRDSQFNEIYKSIFLNHTSQAKAYPLQEEGDLLIICHPAFMDNMQPYVDWKRTIGRKTTMVSTATTGTTVPEIKSYISDYYNDPNNNLTYVLLVGDHAQIPTYTFNSQVPQGGPNPGGSDHHYGQLVGSDPYIEVFVGRFSAENIAHVQTQVQRTIHYERDITTADTWLSRAVGLAAREGGTNGQGHDGSESDYFHMNKIRDRMLSYGYDPVYQEYTCNVPGMSNTTTTQISSRLNAGVGIANYCNHGDIDRWALCGTNYTNSHVNQLQNVGMLPYIFSVACVNGRFMFTTCFAETWMRATHNNQPTGAVATLMATLNLWWNPPMTAQDAFVNICLELPPYYPQQPVSGIKRTFAGAALNATMIMMLVHGSNANSQAKSDFESWLIFGDPTLMLRTITPQDMTVSHNPMLYFGMSEFTVTCDTEGAWVTMSAKNENDKVVILGTAVVEGGVAKIVFDEPVTTFTELTLAVTGFNKVTYLSLIPAGELELLPPQNLTFTIENTHHVLLNWEAPEEHQDLSVKGYNVYRNDELITQEPVRYGTSLTDIAPQNGEYKYEVTALYALDNSSDSLESAPSEPVLVLIEGMSVPSEVQTFQIFPNPARDNITIEGIGLNRVEIYDIQRRKLAEYNNLTGSLIINDLNKYENGIYLVRLYSDDNQIVIKRLVVVR